MAGPDAVERTAAAVVDSRSGAAVPVAPPAAPLPATPLATRDRVRGRMPVDTTETAFGNGDADEAAAAKAIPARPIAS